MKKIRYLYCTVSCTVSRDDRTIKIMLIPTKRCKSNEKRVIVTHFTMKIIRTYLYMTCNKKILFVKKILAYCWYSPTSPFFLLLSEKKNTAITRKCVVYSESKYHLRISLAHPRDCHFAHVQWFPLSTEKPQTPFREIRVMFMLVPVR